MTMLKKIQKDQILTNVYRLFLANNGYNWLITGGLTQVNLTHLKLVDSHVRWV